MRYVAAYMLAVMGGTENPTADDIKMIIGSVGVESEDDKIKLVIDKLKGKDIEELIKDSQDLLANVSFSGTPQVATTETANVQEKTETKTDKPAAGDDSDSDDSDMGINLFD